MKSNHICPYEKYYQQQAGSGIAAIYKGAPYQRGHGIGSFVGRLFRSILPLISTGAKVVGKEAMRAGVGLLNYVIEHRPAGDSVRGRFREATNNLKRKADEKIDSLMKGSGYKRRSLPKSKLSSSTPTSITKRRTLIKNKGERGVDIFT